MPESPLVEGTGDPGELAALQQDWYQDIVLEELGQRLRTGISWCWQGASGERARWAFSGREIIVLAAHERLSGFVICPRLIIGEEHVVLCTQNRLADALAAIALAGSPHPIELQSGTGVPDGWVGLRGVVPHNAVAQSNGGEVLDVLRPLAQAEIALNGGIRLTRASWLAGYPPQIHLRGDASAAGTLYVDDHAAVADVNGAYRAPGWDSPGEHLIRCASGTRTYRIIGGRERWEAWHAYTWSVGATNSTDGRRPSICGALVLPPRTGRSGQRMLSVPATNPVLVGARPGEIYTSRCRTDIRAHDLAVFPPFEAVWAFPGDVFHCSRRSRIISVQATAPTRISTVRGNTNEIRRLRAWCSMILDANKRLALESDDPIIRELWVEYQRAARGIRKQLK